MKGISGAKWDVSVLFVLLFWFEALCFPHYKRRRYETRVLHLPLPDQRLTDCTTNTFLRNPHQVSIFIFLDVLKFCRSLSFSARRSRWALLSADCRAFCWASAVIYASDQTLLAVGALWLFDLIPFKSKQGINNWFRPSDWLMIYCIYYIFLNIHAYIKEYLSIEVTFKKIMCHERKKLRGRDQRAGEPEALKLWKRRKEGSYQAVGLCCWFDWN